MEEGFPICGMDEVTIDYLIAALSVEVGDLEVASKMISSILVNPSVNARMKERTRTLKDVVVKELTRRKNS